VKVEVHCLRHGGNSWPIASIAGVSTAGIQIATLLCSSIRFVKGLEDEIKNVAREVETLSSVFEEISTTLQLGNEELSSSTTKFNVQGEPL
jgi:hypothetical protein